MGFYGNITNVNNTTFAFDKIYSNYTDMRCNELTDNVYIGRYVLIEYDNDGNTFHQQLFIQDDKFYIDSGYQIRALYAASPADLLKLKPENPDHYIVKTEAVYVINEDGIKDYYICSGRTGSYATFTKIIESGDDNVYLKNYLIDSTNASNSSDFNKGRGYDATVWQKVYVEGVEKYVQIAELNSVVPSFGLVVDAPSIEPIVPHFDADTNNVSYKLHIQPQWGLRVKEKEDDEQSDTKVSYTGTIWDPISNRNQPLSKSNYDGSIFFNRKGFIPGVRYKNNENNQFNEETITKDNRIELTPTGISGRKYNLKHGVVSNPKTAPDVQELTIQLPAIGNVISAVWDLVYGTGLNPESDETPRNMDINWNSLEGERMVKADSSGFNYMPEKTQTIAGCINSVHDLMGMIVNDDIKDLSNAAQLEAALTDKIYHINGKFYIKDKTYVYSDVIPEDTSVKNMQQFPVYNTTHFYNYDNNYYLETNGYRLGTSYYILREGQEINTKTLYAEEWKKDYYYYVGEDGKFYLDNNDYPDKDKRYYEIIFKDLETLEYVDNKTKYFFPSEYSDEVYQELFPEIQEGKTGSALFYFGYPIDENGNELTDQEENYFKFKRGVTDKTKTRNRLKYIKNYTIESSTVVGDGEQTIDTYDFKNAEVPAIALEIIDFTEDSFYHFDEINSSFEKLNSVDEIDPEKKYYKMTSEEAENAFSIKEIGHDFYQPNVYYYKEDSNYILAKHENKLLTDGYYEMVENIAPISSTTIFYEPNKYFYNNGSEMVMDKNPTMTDGREYHYDYYTLYVKDPGTDEAYNVGEKLNINVDPDLLREKGIQVAPRQEGWIWKELTGFARTLNTIHGLILHINNLIKFDDNLTRDTHTVQGCINKINDIINKIDSLIPNHFIAINEYGQMTSMEPKGDSWISVTVNKDNDDSVTITHTGPVASNESKKDDLTPKFGDTFTIEDWYFDSKGHKSNKTEHTVMIPKGSLNNFEATEASVLTGISMVPETGVITQTNANVGTLKLEGYQQDVEGALTISEQNTINEGFNTIQTYVNTLDYSDSSTSQFISKITQVDGQVAVERAAAGTLVLTSKEEEKYTVPETASAIAKTDSIITAFGKVEAQIALANKTRTDEVKVLTDNLNKEIEDRTKAIAQEVTDRDAAILVETNARIAAIQALDATITVGESEVITSVSQADGLVSADKKAVGDLKLTGWQLGASTDNEAIANTDTVYSAFAKTQRQINSNQVELNTLKGIVTTDAVQKWNATSDWAETDAASPSYISNKPDNLVMTDSTFQYTNTDGTTANMTLNDLFAYIAGLESRIKTLEDAQAPAPDGE